LIFEKYKHANTNIADLRKGMTTILMHRAANKIEQASKEVIYAFLEGEDATSLLQATQKLTNLPPHNLKNTRRTVATHFIEQNKYRI